jgi:hypothetical protein
LHSKTSAWSISILLPLLRQPFPQNENLGGEWHVASYIVSRMVHAPKCRAADDLLLAADNHPDFEDERLAFAFRSIDDLTQIAVGTNPLPIRALAAWYALGTGRRLSPRLSSRRGDPAAVFNVMPGAGISIEVTEIAREGFRKTGELLCPYVALLCPLHQHETAIIEDDAFPPEVMAMLHA